MPRQRNHQISVRISREINEWLDRRAKEGMETKAEVVRTLIEDSMAREGENELLDVFNEAAEDLTALDRQERDLVAGSFIGAEEPEK